ncbi:MAG: ParB/RepB/Spo0J family partition protein [Chloroflexi bacterium]|nr:ParB/RepB/Spo0J family partition protein [Chloroflexota bacterium]
MLIYVPLSQIDDNPFQARQEYGDIADLAGRIAAARANYPDSYGLMQIPRGRVIFRNATEPNGKVYSVAKALTLTDKNRVLYIDPAVRVQLAFGHRRLRAFRHLWGAQEIGYERGWFPVHIGELNDEQMLDAVWSENRERKDISAVEEAELLARKLSQSKSQREVAEAWGVDRSTVANRLRLLELPAEVQQANRDGRLSERSCLALAPVLKLKEAVPGDKWKKDYYSPEPPAAYVSKLLENPNGTTSEDIRKYAERAIKHAGVSLPKFVADFETGVSGKICQSTCRGCGYRVNNHCMVSACLAEKEQVIAECVLTDAADELGVHISDRAEDFADYEEYKTRALLAALWKGGQQPGTNFVIRWQPSGAMVRPYGERELLWDDHRFDNEGRAGIALGHRGFLPLHLLPSEAKEKVEDIASATDRAAWRKEAAKLGKEVEKRAKAAMVDALYLPAGDAAGIIAALMLEPKDDAVDGFDGLEYEPLLKQFIAFMWDKGRGIKTYYDGWRQVQLVRRLLSRAGLNADKVTSTGMPLADMRRAAILALDFWYERRNYGSYDWPDCKIALDAALAAIHPIHDLPEAEATELLNLDYELRRALRDMETRKEKDALEAAEAALRKAERETSRKLTAANLAGDEDGDLYSDEDDYDYDAEICRELEEEARA